MTEQQALKIMLVHDSRLREIVRRISCFQKGMTSAEYAIAANINLGQAYLYCSYYGLKFVKTKFTAASKRAQEHHEAIATKWDKTKTITQNAEALKIHYAKAQMIAKKFKLESRFHFLRPTMQKRIFRLKELDNKGLKDTEICRIIGCTREYVRQLRITLANEERRETKK